MNYGGQRLKPQLVTPSDKTELTTRTWHVIAAVRNEPSFNNLIDLSAVLIRHGRLDEAVKLLQFLERKYPGRYQSAANVGTAYELMGRNKDALTWIREGIRRNPRDHYGTEWLHVRILEAKMGLIPKSAPGHSILNLDFGKGAMPLRPSNLPLDAARKPLPLYTIAVALRYQLLERIEFVAAPDLMVAGLLLDWGNLELLAGSVESADVLYDAALRYGSTEGPTIALRKSKVAQIMAQSKAQGSPAMGACELCEPPD